MTFPNDGDYWETGNEIASDYDVYTDTSADDDDSGVSDDHGERL